MSRDSSAWGDKMAAPTRDHQEEAVSRQAAAAGVGAAVAADAAADAPASTADDHSEEIVPYKGDTSAEEVNSIVAGARTGWLVFGDDEQKTSSMVDQELHRILDPTPVRSAYMDKVPLSARIPWASYFCASTAA